MDDEVVNWNGVKRLGIPYCRAHIWRMMAVGEFPQAFKLGKHRNSPPVWWRKQIIQWLHAKANTRSDIAP